MKGEAPAQAGALTPPNERNTTMATTMSAAEFRCIREHLGLTIAWLVDYLGVSERSVNRFGDGQQPIPPGVADDMLELEQLARADVADKIAWLTDIPVEKRELITYRTDAALQLVSAGDPYPASWHRAIAARVREHLKGVTLTYAPEA